MWNPRRPTKILNGGLKTSYMMSYIWGQLSIKDNSNCLDWAVEHTTEFIVLLQRVCEPPPTWPGTPIYFASSQHSTLESQNHILIVFKLFGLCLFEYLTLQAATDYKSIGLSFGRHFRRDFPFQIFGKPLTIYWIINNYSAISSCTWADSQRGVERRVGYQLITARASGIIVLLYTNH